MFNGGNSNAGWLTDIDPLVKKVNKRKEHRKSCNRLRAIYCDVGAEGPKISEIYLWHKQAPIPYTRRSRESVTLIHTHGQSIVGTVATVGVLLCYYGECNTLKRAQSTFIRSNPCLHAVITASCLVHWLVLVKVTNQMYVS